MSIPVRKTVCARCPYRRHNPIALSPDDAESLASFALHNLSVCHALKQETECAGSVRFRAGGDAEICGSIAEVVAAQATATGRRARLWGVDGHDEHREEC